MNVKSIKPRERGHPLYALLSELDRVGLHYTIGRYRPDTVMVTLTLACERVEIDVFDDGRMEVSRFRGAEDVVGDETLVGALIKQAEGDL